MDINEFINKYNNHPVLFIGSGFSFRYLKNTYTWDGLLSKVCESLYESDEQYLDIKAKCTINGICSYEKAAKLLEDRFNAALENDRYGKFEKINDSFYENMRQGKKLSRFKMYIAGLVNQDELLEDKKDEIDELKRARKNIVSIITTNYDKLVEKIFEFKPLVGNDILLSNPYGSVYKIHGSVDEISKIIITDEDYKNFDEQYELIRAQMLSIFIHNPIIFLGYSITDENIKKILQTVFSYIPENSPEAEKVRSNFLLVEYDKDSLNKEITDHDIVIKGNNIRINKLKTNDYLSLYKALSTITLPISAMDIRKVQSVVKEIYSGGSIQVMITENIDSLKNSDRILAIGSSKTISYKFMTIKEMMQNYFTIIEESNAPLLLLINSQTISDSQYFPIYAFSSICPDIQNVAHLKEIQEHNVTQYLQNNEGKADSSHSRIKDILGDKAIAESYKKIAIILSFSKGNIDMSDIEVYLKSYDDKKSTEYRRLLCLYDMKRYKNAE